MADTLFIPDAGALLDLGAIRTHLNDNLHNLILIKASFGEDHALTFTDLTEANFAGYARSDLTSDWVVNAFINLYGWAQIHTDTKFFEKTAGTNNTLYGWAIIDATNKVRYASSLGTTFAMNTTGEVFGIVPAMEYKGQTDIALVEVSSSSTSSSSKSVSSSSSSSSSVSSSSSTSLLNVEMSSASSVSSSSTSSLSASASSSSSSTSSASVSSSTSSTSSSSTQSTKTFIPNEGKLLDLNAIRTHLNGNTHHVWLLQGNIAEDHALVLANVTEATFTGYARQLLRNDEYAAAVIDANDSAYITARLHTWTKNGATGNTITGWAIVYNSNTLRHVCKFESSVAMTTNGTVLTIRPGLIYGSATAVSASELSSSSSSSASSASSSSSSTSSSTSSTSSLSVSSSSSSTSSSTSSASSSTSSQSSSSSVILSWSSSSSSTSSSTSSASSSSSSTSSSTSSGSSSSSVILSWSSSSSSTSSASSSSSSKSASSSSSSSSGVGGSTQTKFPGTITSSFTNGDNMKADDGAYATFDLTFPPDTGNADATNYGFTTSGTIDGVEVIVECKESAAAVKLDNVFLYFNGATQGDNKGTATEISTSDTVYTFGGPTDKWNSGVISSDVNGSGFGCRIKFTKISGTPTVSVDYVKIKVYYTP